MIYQEIEKKEGASKSHFFYFTTMRRKYDKFWQGKKNIFYEGHLFQLAKHGLILWKPLGASESSNECSAVHLYK